MKIALIIPNNNSANQKNYYEYKFISRFIFSKKFFSYPLAIPTLASLTPPEHEVRIFDENLENIDYSWDADLAGITVLTMNANKAYSISESYRSRGVKTVLGGIHPSMCPDEALQHCDSIVIGEAEGVWQTLLRDAQLGYLRSQYKAENFVDLVTSPIPSRSLLAKNDYISDIVQTTRGCPFHCEFCSVHAYSGTKIRNKTVNHVIEDIKEIQNERLKYKKKAVFFADDNIIANRKFARELFVALKEYNIKWSCQASINISRHDELLELMKESGCGAILIGLESVSSQNLSRMDKGVNMKHDYLEAIEKIQSYGIRVDGSFVVGYDFDSENTFNDLIDFIDESKLLMPLINLITPFPGTKLFKRFEEEGRIIHKDWSKYDTKSLVFVHPRMSHEELLREYRRIIRHVYSFDTIYKKLQYYWNIDFWKHLNENDPIKFKYRLLFFIRLFTLLFSLNIKRSKFILKIIPRIFSERTRISVILALMAYNDYAYSL
ncbi:MAG: radical SAM protein [Nitrospiraceae bacterium]|nr:MAG: radical SAM protein [Nitrospiraceae bacterium]